MKTLILLLSVISSLVASAIPPVGGGEGGIPENVSFGKSVITNALANVSEGFIEVTGDGLSESSYEAFAFLPVDSSTELANIVRLHKPTVRVKNPLEPVFVRSVLEDEDGNELLEAWTSYRHVVRRDSNGRKTYIVPRGACNLYYQVLEQVIEIDDVESAVASGVDGNIISLVVNGDRIRIPGHVASNPEYWNLLQVTLSDGQVIQYDGSGSRMRGLVDILRPEYVDVQGIDRVELEDGYYLERQYSPQYGWNPLVEFTVAEKGYITLDLRANGWARPTYVRVYTLNQERGGGKPDWIQYELEDTGYRNTLDVPLNPGTYFMEMEWPQYLEYRSGGKG